MKHSFIASSALTLSRDVFLEGSFMVTAQQLVILDRDGVINHDSDAYIKSLDEWIPYPSAIRAIARLTQAGFTVAVATNQSGIARGYYDDATLSAMHERFAYSGAGGRWSYSAYRLLPSWAR